MATRQSFSFKKGLRQIPQGKIKEVKESIMRGLGITTKNSWYRRLRGQVEPLISEVEKIEDIFYLYNVTDIWGE